jgi:broad specificity phosphatase PhoE
LKADVLNGYAAGMRAILIRHYKTESNEAGRIVGWGDSPPCPDWKVGVDYIETRLRDQGVEFDAIYSSDLQRSLQTARIYASSLGITDVVSDPALKEINYGGVQTREKSWVFEHYPQHKKDPDLVYPDGESFRQMQRRSVDFFNRLALSQAQRTILVVTHAGVIRGLVSHFLGLDYRKCLSYGIPFRYIGDFLFEGTNCLRYDEPGKLSGFVRDGAIEIPFARSVIAS